MPQNDPWANAKEVAPPQANPAAPVQANSAEADPWANAKEVAPPDVLANYPKDDQGQPAGEFEKFFNFIDTPLTNKLVNLTATPSGKKEWQNRYAPQPDRFAGGTYKPNPVVGEAINEQSTPANLATAALLTPEVSEASALRPIQRGVQAGLASNAAVNTAKDVSQGNYGAAGLDALMTGVNLWGALHRGGPLPQQAVMPEAAQLPREAVESAEHIFKAAAPVGNDPNFRAQLYTATPDLAEIGRRTSLAEAKGGVILPDMRMRATVNQINDYLKEMYNSERLPQVQRNAFEPIQTNFSEDATDGLKYLTRQAPADARAVARRALTGEMNVSSADQLSRAVNAELQNFEAKTTQGQANVLATSRNIAALKALDQELTGNLNDTLQHFGETGISDYERRYAALSAVRSQLQKRMTGAELNTPGIVKTVGNAVRATLFGGKEGIASASQAAVADVKAGQAIEKGLKGLAGTDLQPTRSGSTPDILNNPAPGSPIVTSAPRGWEGYAPNAGRVTPGAAYKPAQLPASSSTLSPGVAPEPPYRADFPNAGPSTPQSEPAPQRSAGIPYYPYADQNPYQRPGTSLPQQRALPGSTNMTAPQGLPARPNAIPLPGQIAEAIKITVRHPDGRVGTIPLADLQEALRQGYKRVE